MKHFSRILPCLVMTLASATVIADTYKDLVVLLRNGHTDVYKLELLPHLEFSDAKMVIQPSATTNVITYLLSEVERFYFEERGDAVKSLHDNGLYVEQTSPFTYEIHGLATTDVITVCDISGRIFPFSISHGGYGTATVTLAALPNGIYLIKLGNKRALKINKAQ